MQLPAHMHARCAWLAKSAVPLPVHDWLSAWRVELATQEACCVAAHILMLFIEILLPIRAVARRSP